MDSSINNTNSSSSSSMQTSSIGACIDRYFPTSTHFFDTPANSFPTSAATSSWAHPAPEPSTTLAPGPTGRRTSKKRSRASRRAPTTVLTTDTSNFRAMVQEFTGIPSPPFTSPSCTSLHFPRSLCNPAPAPSFLLKPSPHKFQPPAPTSTLPPITFQSQLVNMMMPQQQAIASSSSSSSGELRLPGVIGSGGDRSRQQQQQQQDAIASCKIMSFPGSMSTSVATEFHSEKGTEGLMDSWICSSD